MFPAQAYIVSLYLQEVLVNQQTKPWWDWGQTAAVVVGAVAVIQMWWQRNKESHELTAWRSKIDHRTELLDPEWKPHISQLVEMHTDLLEKIDERISHDHKETKQDLKDLRTDVSKLQVSMSSVLTIVERLDKRHD